MIKYVIKFIVNKKLANGGIENNVYIRMYNCICRNCSIYYCAVELI
nr:MAG TPA: hypothetical protein [Caudoviricetes sp.]